MKILVDSSVWIWWVRGIETAEVAVLRRIVEAGAAGQSPGALLIGDLVAVEVLRGMKSLKAAREVEANWARFGHVGLGGMAIAVAAADMFRALRAKGITVDKTVDLVIGAWCIENRVALLHADRDFDPMEEHFGLRVVR